MDKNKQIDNRYINTPFAYTKTQNGLTLLQQNVMVRVSAHLQKYIEKFYKDPQLLASKDDPKPLMHSYEKEHVPPVRIRLSELGIASNVYSRVRAALEGILDVKVEQPGYDEEGRPVMNILPLFNRISIPVTDHGTVVKKRLLKDDEDLTEVFVDRVRGYVEISLNPGAIDDMFNMNLGYVTHPVDIARIGKVDKMPLMYYFIRHKMLNFKKASTQVSVEEIRDYLGMIVRDFDGNIIKVQYPHYSRFKARVIDTALNDIKRVYEAGQIDFYFEMKEIRASGKKIGEPDFLEFKKVGTVKNDNAKYRTNSERKLIDTLLTSYPTLDKSRVVAILSGITEDKWNEFKNYAYKDVPRMAEQPHRWNGTNEEFIYHLLEHWEKGRSVQQTTNKPPQQLDLFANVLPVSSKIETKVGEGADKWKAFCKLIIGDAEKSLISRLSFVGMKNDRFCVECSDEDFDMIRKLGIEDKAKEFFGCVGSFAPVFYRG
jgi:hypothetical protein